MSSYSPNPQDVRFSNRETVHADGITVDKVDIGFRRNDKTWSPTISRFFVSAPSKVAVLPYDPYAGKVVFVENFRVGTLNQPEGPWHLELPTRPLVSETHTDTAQNALQEDIACEGLDLEYIGDFYTAPALSTERIFLYCAGVESSQLKSEGRVELLTVQDAIDAVYSNYFRDSSTIISLHWLLANQQRLDLKWQ